MCIKCILEGIGGTKRKRVNEIKLKGKLWEVFELEILHNYLIPGQVPQTQRLP